MQTTKTNIKFSPGRELYPGTQERVCVIMGGIGNIVQAVKGVFDKVRSSEQYDQDILKNLKLLISNISSGMIIGKSGGTIKMLQQEFNIRIQITNKEETKGLPERTMIMISESPESIYLALANILERIMHDPESDKWRRLLSYTTYSATPTTNTISTSSSGNNIPVATSTTDYSTIFSMLHNYTTPSSISSTAYQSMGATPGYPGGDASSLTQAMMTYLYSQSLMSNGTYFSRYAPVMIDGVNLTVPGATLATFEIAIPEVMVTAVFGPSNKVISDIMQTTGTRVQLSGKGDYIPGTYNRKVTVTGPVLSVQSAHLMIMQNIIREQELYRKQGLL